MNFLNLEKKNNEKNKQMLLSFVAVILIICGYFSYIYTLNNDEEALFAVEEDENVYNEMHIGDVQLVSANEVTNFVNTGIVPNDENKININGSVENISNIVNNTTLETSSPNLNLKKENEDSYFYETRLEQENLFSQTIETYQRLIDNTQTSQEQKAIAVQEITNITNIRNGIKIAENLIKNKGYKDVVILVNNGNANVIIKKDKLFNEDISKVQNIVERELSIKIDNINISNN